MMRISETPKSALHELRRELARWLWVGRKGPINRVEAEANLRALVAACPDETIEQANDLKHAVCNQLTKLHGRAQLLSRGIDPNIRIHALRVLKNIN